MLEEIDGFPQGDSLGTSLARSNISEVGSLLKRRSRSIPLRAL
jgi:hypothetical protein